MKTLKLEVGKTYLSRAGEEVKIVRMGNRGWDYWEGSNGEWYYEGGKWSYVAEEHPKDLIKEVPEPTRHTFDIPNGVKKVTVEQVGNRIVVEMVPEKEPKPGDVMINKQGNVYMFKAVVDSDTHEHCSWLGKSRGLANRGTCQSGRPATPEEAQPLWDALKKAGKRWNPETMQVEDITESDRIREWVGANIEYGCYTQDDIAEVIEAYLKHKEATSAKFTQVQKEDEK
jgi:hypothetical protein